MASARERQPLEPGRARPADRPTGARSAVSDHQRDDPDQEEAAGQAVEYADGEGAYALFVDTDVS
jgi:hypothetical protein